ncbi:MAG: cell wall hydrolase [Bacillaceae bacterium]|nr:cell wall hydrolase [Bacillaceae bacterium]
MSGYINNSVKEDDLHTTELPQKKFKVVQKEAKKPPLVKKKKQGKQTQKQEGTPQRVGEQAPGGTGTPAQPLPGGETGTPTPGTQGQPSPGGEVPEQTPGSTPELEVPEGVTPRDVQPDTQPVPEEEPIPDDATEGDGPTIEKAINVPQGFTENDIQIMAQAVYGEARGEPYIGQVAVAAVILNRINSPTFPNTASGVIFEPRAFTAVADGQIYLQPNETARRAVLDAINGQDPSGNAMYYFNPDTATSGWIWSRPQIKRIGKHIFCK